MKAKKILKIIIIVLCVSTIVSFFLPFCSAKGSHLNYLERNKNEKVAYNLDMKNSDIIDMSTFEHLKIMFYELGEINKVNSNTGINVESAEVSFFVVIIILFIISLLLLLLFEVLNKRILSIIFNVLFLFNSFLLYGSFVADNNNYGPSFSCYYYFIAGFAILGCTIALIVLNRTMKNHGNDLEADSKKEKQNDNKEKLFTKIEQKSIKISKIGSIIMMIGSIFPLHLYSYKVKHNSSFSYSLVKIPLSLSQVGTE